MVWEVEGFSEVGRRNSDQRRRGSDKLLRREYFVLWQWPQQTLGETAFLWNLDDLFPSSAPLAHLPCVHLLSLKLWMTSWHSREASRSVS